ncbi:MAG: HDOD domain-containing protein [Magnetococcales bacterium]|nr:HDOD domain-containing protein [Magnetococcales bacterium]
MGELHHKLIKLVDRMPAFPKSVHRVLQLTADINFRPKDLIQVIDHDPVLTVKILKLVNSAYFGLSRSIMSINQAAVFVGINTIKNLTLTVATSGMLPLKGNTPLGTDDFLLHALATATISKRLAMRLGVSEIHASDFFVAGLLHDFGKVVFSQFMPREFDLAIHTAEERQIGLHQAEQAVIGADHAEVGAMLGEKWQLPTALVTSIRNHHHTGPDEESLEPAGQMLSDCVQAGNSIAQKMELGQSGSPVQAPFTARMEQRFGCDLDSLINSLTNLTEEIEKTRIFMHL